MRKIVLADFGLALIGCGLGVWLYLLGEFLWEVAWNYWM